MTLDSSKDRTSIAQNIYDNETFFSGYRALRQNDTGLNGALEVPALRRCLPPLSGLNVLDLGCGFGDFSRWARSQGAATVTGVDISFRMLAEARRLTSDPYITYVQSAFEDYHPAPEAFDLAVSSLALHYVQDYASVIRRIYAALTPGGRLVFSVEHPICTAYPAGWITNDSGQALYWPVDRYGDESARHTRWFVDDVIKYHRTVATYVNTLLQNGFRLLHLGEPVPTEEALAQRPDLDRHCRRPPFLLLAAEKTV